jgi:hypothetical protein
MTILRTYKTGSWQIVPIHYSHDPEKGADWAEKARAGYLSQESWLRENEIDFGAHMGARVYSRFNRQLHVIPGLELHPLVPIGLCMDFNVSPMCWLISQTIHGKERCVAEVYQEDDATVERGVSLFRTMVPAHRAEVIVYGDASGHNRGQTARSNYYLAELAFSGYPARVSFRVPVANPAVKDRINAVNRILVGVEGLPRAEISDKCTQLCRDLDEVVWRPDGSDILKVSRPEDPYRFRTHMSDAWGYKIAQEWPVVTELSATKRKPYAPMVAKRTLGELR